MRFLRLFLFAALVGGCTSYSMSVVSSSKPLGSPMAVGDTLTIIVMQIPIVVQ